MLETITPTQLYWATAILTTITVIALIAYFLRSRCKEFIYLFTILAGLVTLFCFMPLNVIAKVFVVIGYLVFLFACLVFNSIKTPDDSPLKQRKNFYTEDIFE